jgi:hypothetical protein
MVNQFIKILVGLLILVAIITAAACFTTVITPLVIVAIGTPIAVGAVIFQCLKTLIESARTKDGE